MKRVVITGMGVACSNAVGKQAFEQACLEGKMGIQTCTAFDTTGLSTDQFGECPMEAADRMGELLRLSVTEMLADAGYEAEELSAMGSACRMFFGTLVATNESDFAHSRKRIEGAAEDGTLAKRNDYIAYAKELSGVKGMVHLTSAACASSTISAGMAFDYIRNGICEVAVMGGADPLTKVTAYGFQALKSLSCGLCNPYDESRDGINIGEGSAIFLVESLEHALARGAHVYCEIKGYGLGNDAYHATSPDPNGDGAYHTMMTAIREGGIEPASVDYINGHGTGTPINDAMEAKAIARVFAGTGKKPFVSSTKATVGHCMGASGAVELASTILTMNRERYLPMPRLQTPISEELYLSDQSVSAKMEYAISNSFAFAGNSASLLIGRYREEAG